jgi:hypothetical protein
MRTVNFLRAAAMALALAAPVTTASTAFAQNQFTDEEGVTHYGNFSKGTQLDAGLQPSIQQSGPTFAQSRSNMATDAGDLAFANHSPAAAANLYPYNPESILTQEGANTW